MAANSRTIAVAAESELGQTLKAARESGEPVVVDTGENRYTLLVVPAEPEADVFVGYDPQAAIVGLRALNNALAGIEREQLLDDLRAQREQNSAGRPA
jgi:hypothetical protein